jgi:hypothetical protein
MAHRRLRLNLSRKSRLPNSDVAEDFAKPLTSQHQIVFDAITPPPPSTQRRPSVRIAQQRTGLRQHSASRQQTDKLLGYNHNNKMKYHIYFYNKEYDGLQFIQRF